MTTKVNDVYEVNSQFLTGSLVHFTTTCADMDETAQATYDQDVLDTAAAKAAWDADPLNGTLEAAYDAAVIAEAASLAALNEHLAAVKRAVQTVEARATLVVMGVVAAGDLRVAVENNGTWTAATLEAELNLDWTGSAWTAAAFAY